MFVWSWGGESEIRVCAASGAPGGKTGARPLRAEATRHMHTASATPVVTIRSSAQVPHIAGDDRGRRWEAAGTMLLAEFGIPARVQVDPVQEAARDAGCRKARAGAAGERLEDILDENRTNAWRDGREGADRDAH